LLDQIELLTALCTTALLGGSLLVVLRAERRRASIELRLKALVSPPPSTDELVTALRRPPPRRKALPVALAARLELAFAATGNRVGPLHLTATVVAAAAATMMTARASELTIGPTIALSGVAATAAPFMLLRMMQSRYRRRFLDTFPDALDMIVRGVRAGLPAPEAIELAAREIQPPVGNEFRRLFDEMRIGVDMEEALQSAAERIQVPDFQFFVVSLLLQRQTGGGIAETLANLSTIIRQRKALRQKARALSAEAKASAALVAAMPFIAGIGLFLINRDLVSVLLLDPRGRFMLGLAIVSILLGVVTMKVLINKSLR
jgi:tight adherence protein B